MRRHRRFTSKVAVLFACAVRTNRRNVVVQRATRGFKVAVHLSWLRCLCRPTVAPRPRRTYRDPDLPGVLRTLLNGCVQPTAMEPSVRVELTTCCLQDSCSTTELTRPGVITVRTDYRPPSRPTGPIRSESAHNLWRVTAGGGGPARTWPTHRRPTR